MAICKASHLALIMNIRVAKQKSNDMDKQKNSNSRTVWLMNCWHCRQGGVQPNGAELMVNYLVTF